MNPYLTSKAQSGVPKRRGLLITCGILAVSAVSAAFSLYEEGELDTLLVECALILLFLLPFIRQGLAVHRHKMALQLANYFAACPEASIPLPTVAAALGMRRADKEIKSLLAHAYLCNVTLDLGKNAILLYAPVQADQPQRTIQVECPYCGASNTVPYGRVARCTYCNQTLSAQLDARKGEDA